MDKQEVFDKVVAVIKPFVRDEAALKSVSDSSVIIKDLKVNSARLVDIVIGFEDAFEISIDDAIAYKVKTVGDAVDAIVMQLGAKPA